MLGVESYDDGIEAGLSDRRNVLLRVLGVERRPGIHRLLKEKQRRNVLLRVLGVERLSHTSLFQCFPLRIALE